MLLSTTVSPTVVSFFIYFKYYTHLVKKNVWGKSSWRLKSKGKKKGEGGNRRMRRQCLSYSCTVDFQSVEWMQNYLSPLVNILLFTSTQRVGLTDRSLQKQSRTEKHWLQPRGKLTQTLKCVTHIVYCTFICCSRVISYETL